MTRALAALLGGLALLLGLVAAPSPATAAITVGIADQKPAMFTDPRFLDLEITRTRYVVPWDVLSERWTREELDTWMAAARRARVQPLLTFGHSRRPGLRRMLPTPRRLQREFRRLRARYPWATEWATWNEPNHCGEPTCKRPDVVARMYDGLVRACPTKCTILAAEVLDMPNMASWVRRLQKYARTTPRYWGLHNYIDTNRFRTSGTRALLKAVKGTVWITETGGVLRRQDARNRVVFPGGSDHAVKALRWLFTRLVTLDERRITRVYLYQWNASTPDDTWDSALVASNGLARKTLSYLEVVLARVRAAKRRGAVARP